MHDILPALGAILMIFLMMGVGVGLRKLGKLPDASLKVLNQAVISIAQPALMLTSTQCAHTPETLGGFLTVMVAASLLMMAVLSVCFFAYRRAGCDAAPAMAMISAMPNVGFIGIPVMQAVFGDAALIYVAGFIIAYNVAQWSVGAAMFEGLNVKSLRGILNPVMACAVIGIAMLLGGVTLPTPVMGALNHFSNLNTPLSMLVIGARLASIRPRDMGDGRLWVALSVKLIALPLAALLVGKTLGMSGTALGVLVVGFGMPAAASCQMMAERYQVGTDFAAKGVSVSTLCFIATLPLLVLVA